MTDILRETCFGETENSAEERLSDELHAYWNGRAEGYSEYNQGELENESRHLWKKELIGRIAAAFPDKTREQIRILDVGTGPGFFARILAEEGYFVTAVDLTENMLEEAKKNAGEYADRICFQQQDVQSMTFEDNAFDVLITRNVTWNLPKPAQAYKEWLRVMAAGGILLNYDADWYGYLKDDEKQKAFQEDREQAKAMDLDDANVGENFDVCERLAEDLPLTGQKRPEWDLAVMREAGYASAEADPEIWKTVLREDEKIMWASTPMFLIQGRK